MRINPEQLNQHLATTLLPVYLLCGDEPMQKTEALDALCKHCKKQGAERQLFFITAGFNWNDFAERAGTTNMFNTKQLMTLYFDKLPDKTAQKYLIAYLQQPAAENTLILHCPKLDRNAKNSTWFKRIDTLGAVIITWPIKSNALSAWLRKRATAMQLRLSTEAIQLLAQRTEGNLLAASQSLQRLKLIAKEDTDFDIQTVSQLANDMSSSSVFELVDHALNRDVSNALRGLERLRQQGTAPILILSSLVREIRVLANSYDVVERGSSLNAALERAGVWKSRIPLMRKAHEHHTANTVQNLLRLAYRADNSAKGVSKISVWQTLNRLVLRLAGVRVPI